MPIETIWGDNFRIALIDSSLNNPIINYSAISTSGIVKATAIPEGKSVDIYISRDQNDTINSSIIDLVWQIFDMEEEEVNRFIDYINNFDDHERQKNN